MQACITAAVQVIQAKNPGFSTARCWHTMFAKYCEIWQQQHPLMGLWSAPGGWVGAVRAGGLLTVLRGVTPAEVLAHESTPGVLQRVMEVSTVLLPRFSTLTIACWRCGFAMLNYHIPFPCSLPSNPCRAASPQTLTVVSGLKPSLCFLTLNPGEGVLLLLHTCTSPPDLKP